MKIKLNEDGTPVFKDGLITLVDEDTTEEFQINPVARHLKCQTFEKEVPQKNADIKTLKNQLKTFTELQENHPDLFSEPEAIAERLQELEDLKAKGTGEVDEKIAGLHAKYKKEIETLKGASQEAAEEAESSIKNLKRQMQMQQYLIPWAKSDQLKGYNIPPDPDLLERLIFVEIDGKQIKIQDDGTVLGWDGAAIVDYANEGGTMSPDKVLEVILNTHPRRDRIRLSNIPGGGGMPPGGGGGGGSEYEDYFKPGATRNLTEQLKLKASNPALYDQLKNKYS